MATAKKRRTKGSGSIVKRGKVYYLVIKEDGKVVSKKVSERETARLRNRRQRSCFRISI